MLIINFFSNNELYISYLNSNMKKIFRVLTTPVIIVILIYIIFIVCNRHKGIIEDMGLIKLLCFSVGILFFYTSIYFVTYTDYIGCSLNFFFKHIGLSLILITLYIIISLAHELGIYIDEDEKCKFISTSKNNMDENINSNTNPIKNDTSDMYVGKNLKSLLLANIASDKKNGIDRLNKNSLNESQYQIQKTKRLSNNTDDEIYNNNQNPNNNSNNSSSININRTNHIISLMSIEKLANLRANQTENKNIASNLKKSQSLFIESIILYIINAIYICLVIIIYKFKEYNDKKYNISHILQEKNGQWVYKCNLERHDIVFHSLYFLILIMIIIKGNHVLQYECIFKSTKFITNSSYMFFALGPLINVIIIS